MGDDGEGLRDLGQASDVNPRISVVLAVFNGAARLSETMRSILGQTERSFELIVVNDGSTDATPAILAESAEGDARIRVITQQNAGLTHSLIRGCDAARAPLIARQDCGDLSKPDRLRRMIELMEERSRCVLAASEAAYTGPENEVLYTTRHADKNIRQALLHAQISAIMGLPHHGAAVMRTESYRRAGGYRPEFYFAQDLDLWIRMASLGDVCIVDEVLYDARCDERAISSLHRSQQVTSAKLAIALRDRPNALDQSALLRKASAIRPGKRARSRRLEAKALYFIATCLRRQNDPRWRRYASLAVRRSPLHVRSWLLLLRGALT
jgi:glycosyltransferase involved in cell wall biosynthesis